MCFAGLESHSTPRPRDKFRPGLSFLLLLARCLATAVATLPEITSTSPSHDH